MVLRRTPMTQLIIAVMALALAVLGGHDMAGAAEGGPQVTPPSGLVARGKLSYGVAATFPPFEYHAEEGGLTGFDVEMAARLAEYMGLEPAPLDMDFDGLIPALQGRRLDIINSAMYITPARAAQVDFVPYLIIGEAIIVRAGNPRNIQELDDLCGLTVAVTRGAIGEVYMTDQAAVCQAKGLPRLNILALPTNQDAMLAVLQGQADAFDTSIPGAAHLQQQRPGQFEVATTFELGTVIGIAVRKDDADMKRALEEAMALLVESGEFDELLRKYNLPLESSFFRN